MDTPGRRAPDEDAVDHAAGHWTPCQHHGGACHRPSPKSDAAAEAAVLSPRLTPSCPSSASLSFFLFLWKGNVSADEGDGRENKRLRPTYSAAVPRRATPWTPFGFSIKTVKNFGAGAWRRPIRDPCRRGHLSPPSRQPSRQVRGMWPCGSSIGRSTARRERAGLEKGP